jgi:hypothetical protein
LASTEISVGVAGFPSPGEYATRRCFDFEMRIPSSPDIRTNLMVKNQVLGPTKVSINCTASLFEIAVILFLGQV